MNTILIDTNILLRMAQPEQMQFCELANSAVTTLIDMNNQLVLAPQVLQEFYSVATRPTTARGGLNLAPQDALDYFRDFAQLANLLPELPTHSIWQDLVKRYQVSGTSTHDARLAAFMIAHQIPCILTFNEKDFSRYAPEGITTLTPQSTLSH